MRDVEHSAKHKSRHVTRRRRYSLKASRAVAPGQVERMDDDGVQKPEKCMHESRQAGTGWLAAPRTLLDPGNVGRVP